MDEALVASDTYLAKNGAPSSPEDLQQHRLIQFRFATSNQLAPLLLTDKGHRLQVKMSLAMIVNDTDLMIDAAEQGLGIGRIFAPWVKEQLASGRLRPVLQAYWYSYPGLHIYFPQHSQKAKRIRVLIDFLRDRAIRNWS